MKQPNETAGAAALAPIQLIKVSDIVPDPNNRKDHNKESLASLANSIKEDGLLNPIVLRSGHGGKFQIIAGERRWRAFQLLKRTEIPARVMGTVGAGEAQKSATRKRLAENFHREDLTPIEKARDLKQLEQDGLSQTEIASFVGAKDQSTVSNFMRLLALPPATQELVQSGKLNAAQAKALCKYARWPKACDFLAALVVKNDLNSKQVEGGFDYREKSALASKGLACDVPSWKTHRLSPAAKKEINADPDFIRMGSHEVMCFAPAKWKAFEEQLDAAEKKERSENSQRSAATRTATPTDNGTLIPKEDEVFAALVPESKLAKRKGQLLCTDSNLWGKIATAAHKLIEDDAEKKIPALCAEAMAELKKAKTIESRFVVVLFTDRDCEYDDYDTDENKVAKQLGLKLQRPGKDVVTLAAKGQAIELLKIQIGVRLESLAQVRYYDSEGALKLLRVVLNREQLGLVNETPEGRAQLLVLTAKQTGLKIPGVETAPPVKSAKKGGAK